MEQQTDACTGLGAIYLSFLKELPKITLSLSLKKLQQHRFWKLQ
jgi:hypothetical protein